MNNNRTNQIAELLLQTGTAHHAAFADADGDDPDWPLWYAEYLSDRLPPLLGKEQTISELVYLMITLAEQHRLLDPDSKWHHYYAQQLVGDRQETARAELELVPWAEALPSLTVSQMIEVDRLMIEAYQISLLQMIENAGRHLAHLARIRFLDGDPRGKRIAILAGTGGNGGGALAAARHLANFGAGVTVYTTRAAVSFAGIPGQQLAILKQMHVPISEAPRMTE